jgi:hypothetical protein
LFGSDRDPKEDQLCKLSAEISAELLGPPRLEYTPRVNCFVEDTSGNYARAVRCKGFVDYDLYDENRQAIFVRHGLSPQETAEAVFHEAEHLHFFKYLWKEGLTMEEIEAHADQFASRFAPAGKWRSYESVFAELAGRMAKWCAHTGDYERARKYHDQLRVVDPAEAKAIADVVMDPEERRFRSKLEAQRSRREVVARVQAEEAWEEHKRRLRRLDSKYDPVLEQQREREEQRRREEFRRRELQDQRWILDGKVS